LLNLVGQAAPSIWGDRGRTIALKIAAIAMHDKSVRGQQIARDWKFAADLLQRQQNQGA
jgi:hypothetical protein